MDFRKLTKNCWSTAVVVLLAVQCSFGQKAITTEQASSHVGEYSKVCGQVASTHFAYRSRGAPTFINLDQPYPNQVFTALIWVEDRSKFGIPEKRFADRYICVQGVIQLYKGVPEIIVRERIQIQTPRND